MLTSEKNITPLQREYIHIHLSKLKGMIGELIAKKNLLHDRLKKFPERIDTKKEIASIEERMMALEMSIEFIEKWPATCNGSCNKHSEKCDNGDYCPHWNTHKSV